MKQIADCIKKYKVLFISGLLLKLFATLLELLIPYILEHMIDTVALTGSTKAVLLWGALMLFLALFVRFVNVTANRIAIKQAKLSTYDIRRDLFVSSLNLSGNQADDFGLPSLTSRMTSDSYNVQDFLRSLQTMGVRAPIMLLGGIIITMTMDPGLSLILCVLTPIMIFVILTISRKGIPLYEKVQKSLDTIVRILRENITGIRVIKSLSKEAYEKRRYQQANEDLTGKDLKAGIIMALPGPVLTLTLNIGLTAVVLIGAVRVNRGVTQPGVILAFLTYFNMIMMGVMGLNRIFMLLSKASASADRIAAVINLPEDLTVLPDAECAHTDSAAYIRFEDVSFSYGEDGDDDDDEERFAGEQRRMSLENISFEIEKGGSLGIIGATGSGKTTIINLLMRFYDPTSGHVFIGGKDVRSYGREELRRKFGVVFQNDVIFSGTIAENIAFGRDVDENGIRQAAEDACASEFIDEYEDVMEHRAEIRGSNFSGGQKQRILISRALAAHPEILVLDDASSALDYRTDANLRAAVHDHHGDATTIVIAQRVSSVMNLDRVLVLDEGEIIGYGTHDQLMENCRQYREICKTQMGEER